MKATTVLYNSTNVNDGRDRPSLSPELSAAVAARHSRNPDGLDSILGLVAKMPDQKAVDTIFAFTDYGHRSILDMVPVSIHLEDISLFAATMIWSLVKQGGGQERSTRYCNFMEGGAHVRGRHFEPLVNAYAEASAVWSEVAETAAVFDDISNEKVKVRLKKNFVFDRSRYFIPLACHTSMNVTTWGVEWARILSQLASSPWDELREIADRARYELGVTAPHCVKHSHETECNRLWWNDMLEYWKAWNPAAKNEVELEITSSKFEENLPRANRYDPSDYTRRMMPVSYGFVGVSFAEMRDMNRHRPGERLLALSPLGFYGAEDEARRHRVDISKLLGVGKEAVDYSTTKRDHDFVYDLPLGVLVGFYHTNTLGNLIYEIELRTGPGTHYKYREFYLRLHDKLMKACPTLGSMLIGGGEPE